MEIFIFNYKNREVKDLNGNLIFKIYKYEINETLWGFEYVEIDLFSEFFKIINKIEDLIDYNIKDITLIYSLINNKDNIILEIKRYNYKFNIEIYNNEKSFKININYNNYLDFIKNKKIFFKKIIKEFNLNINNYNIENNKNSYKKLKFLKNIINKINKNNYLFIKN